MSTWRKFLSALSVALILPLVGCGGGGDETQVNVDVGSPAGDGIVKEVSGSLSAVDGLSENQGQVLLDVFHGDRAVNKKIKVVLIPDGQPDSEAGKGEGNQAFDLGAGLYSAAITYEESAFATGMSGTISGLKVNAGQLSRYNVVLEAPVGLLQMRFSRSDGPGRPPVGINEQVALQVYAEGADRSVPVAEGVAGDWLVLPAGAYDVKANYDDGAGKNTIEWYSGLEVAAGMAKTRREVHLDLDESGVRIDAFNFSRDVNSHSTVYFFNPGARVEQAQAKAVGSAGESIKVDPGLYDVLLVYKPSDDNLDLEGRAKLEAFEVPERGGVRRQVDVELELALVKVRVMDGEEDISERVELRVKRGGADAVASTSLLDTTASSDHWIEAGTYDIYLEFAAGEGEPKLSSFRGIELSNGASWVQEFSASDVTWVPSPVKLPAEPPRAIDWVPPGDDDSAGDDDDSASDEESSEEPEGEKAAE